MRTIAIVRCVGCGLKKEFEAKSGGDYIKNGFNTVYDVSSGLTVIPVCEACSNKIKTHVKAIEEIVKKEMWKISL